MTHLQQPHMFRSNYEETNILKRRICNVVMLGMIIIYIYTLGSCGIPADERESSYEELDIDYTTNNDGTYTYKDNIYMYKIEVSGIEGESQVTFVALTNDLDTSFEDIANKLKKAEINTEIPEIVVLGWYDGESPKE